MPFSFEFNQQGIKVFVMIGLTVGIAAYFAYVSGFGGIWNSILYGSTVRFGSVDIESVFEGRTGVFKHLVSVLNIVFLYCLARAYAGLQLRGRDLAIFLSSGIFLLLYLLSAAGRGAFVGLILAAIIILSYQYENRAIKFFEKLRANIRLIIFLFPIIIMIIMFGKQFFFALPSLLNHGVEEFIADFLVLNDIRAGNEMNFIRDSLFKEAAHGLSSISAVIDHFIGKDAYLWFRDYWLLPVHIIPTKLLGIEKIVPPTVSAINTEIMQGKLIASTPPAILAMLIYNAGYPGIILMFFYGVLGMLIQNKFLQIENTPERNLLFFYFVYLYGGFIGNADIKVYIYSSIPLVLMIVSLLVRKFIRIFRS